MNFASQMPQSAPASNVDVKAVAEHERPDHRQFQDNPNFHAKEPVNEKELTKNAGIFGGLLGGAIGLMFGNPYPGFSGKYSFKDGITGAAIWGTVFAALCAGVAWNSANSEVNQRYKETYNKVKKTNENFARNIYGTAAAGDAEGLKKWESYYKYRDGQDSKPLLFQDLAKNTPLYYSAGNGHIGVVNYILDQIPGSLNKEEVIENSSSSATTSFGGNTHTSVSTTLKTKVNTINPINIQNNQRRTALHAALYGRHALTAALLLQRGADHRIRDDQNKEMQDLLIERPYLVNEPNLLAQVKAKGLIGLFPNAKPASISRTV